ncbi:siroheme synthase CysG [Minwuia thermotolerans]|uniref:siroheme synthase CysG n=1 Tax=Minwuia thermotolerans TaxID=2056226 RepID=UPI000D6DC3C4|nr:siroheme synthase CysG [Minwuia thermotolerans]
MAWRQKPSDNLDRIGQLAVLPLFFKLDGRAVLAAGGTEAMAWKLELLLAAGAQPVIAASVLSEEVAALAARHGLGRIDLECARMRLSDYAMIVADLTDETEAQSLYDDARASGVPINQIDQPALCTVQFGSIVNRSPVVIGISTDGAAPVLGQRIRSRIEGLLPRALGKWAELARRLRPRVKREIELPSLRRAFWRRFADCALTQPAGPAQEEFETLRTGGGAGGRVTLVGAGPGDPDLLTQKAIRALQDADVILFDALVAPEILELARREAKRLPVGKRGGRPSCKQDEINRLMIRFAGEGKHVVRLKSGDPAFFSRGGEEAAALRALGIAFEFVPGVTAASAAAASLGLTLTDRRMGRQVLFAAGHGRNDETAEIDWHALSGGSTTVALYMGRGRMADLASRAISEGADPTLPVAIGVDISRLGEEWRHTTLSAAAAAARELDGDAPCLILAGRVLETLWTGNGASCRSEASIPQDVMLAVSLRSASIAGRLGGKVAQD